MNVNSKGTESQCCSQSCSFPSRLWSRNKLTHPSTTQESLLAALQNHVPFKEHRKYGIYGIALNLQQQPADLPQTQGTGQRDPSKPQNWDLPSSSTGMLLFMLSKGTPRLPSYLLALLACAPAPCRRGASGRGYR